MIYSYLLFAWPQLHFHYLKKGFFATNKTALDGMFVRATGFLGFFLIGFGLIRDYISYGWFRIIALAGLALSYMLLAVAKPHRFDLFLYFWLLQYSYGRKLLKFWFHLWVFFYFLINFQCSVSCGVALALFYMQIAKFFPPNQALIIAVLNLSMQLSSSVPGFWMFLVDKKILTLSKIMMIWFILSMITMILGLFIFPWSTVRGIVWNICILFLF